VTTWQITRPAQRTALLPWLGLRGGQRWLRPSRLLIRDRWHL